MSPTLAQKLNMQREGADSLEAPWLAGESLLALPVHGSSMLQATTPLAAQRRNSRGFEREDSWCVCYAQAFKEHGACATTNVTSTNALTKLFIGLPLLTSLHSESLASAVPHEEILTACMVPAARDCLGRKRQSFVVHTFRRGEAAPCREWLRQEHLLSSDSLEQAKEWVGLINTAVAACRDRPRTLLVFVNPFSGSKAARHIWGRHAAPVFDLARIQCRVIETTHMDHARDMVAGMKADDLATYDGIVAVGGDGLFQECMIGLLHQRHSGGERAASIAARMRVGHIPAGSTDAVAWSLHGTRSVAAAALHIALGDRLSLDVGRVEGGGNEQRYFVCQAAYGFLGDVMRSSEGMRWMGPSRYDLAGALMYLQLKSYRLELSYREVVALPVQQVCVAECTVCRAAGEETSRRGNAGMSGTTAGTLGTQADRVTAASTASTCGDAAAGGLPVGGREPWGESRFTPSIVSAAAVAAAAAEGAGPAPSTSPRATSSPTAALLGSTSATDGWVQADGEYISIMCVAAPCRSDKSKNGIIPHGHLSDGRMYLVLVSRCNHVDYLRFLIQLTRKGLTHLVFPFVRVVPVTAVQIKPLGGESSWNVDGELLHNNSVHISVQRGAVEVFARSIDL